MKKRHVAQILLGFFIASQTLQFPIHVFAQEEASNSAEVELSQNSDEGKAEYYEDYTIQEKALDSLDSSVVDSAKIKVLKGLNAILKRNIKADEGVTITLENQKVESLTFKLFNFDGQEVVADMEVISESDPVVVKIYPSIQFKPGRYRVSISDDQAQKVTKEFMWGVLAINTGKSVYVPNEDATIQMAVLDELGEMVCNADVTLKVTSPQLEVTSFTTSEGTIIVNPQCYSKDATVVPDYQAVYKVGVEGLYGLSLTATTINGTYTIQDAIEVQEDPRFEVERISATRIYPLNVYPVVIKVTANEDFEGTIKDFVPASFKITKPTDNAISFDTIEVKTANSDKSVLGVEIFDIAEPFKGEHPLTLGFGRQHKDEQMGKKYADFGVIGHDGVDFDLPIGTSVIAVDDGKVVRAKDSDYGNTVVIEHKWGKSYYGHLDKFIATVGDNVKKGELIALSGNSGLSSGPHLHFGIKPNKNDPDNGYFGKVNPLPMLGVADTGVEHGVVAGVSTTSDQINQNEIQEIVWKVSLKKGETIELGYQFDAPDISPEMYLLGPLEMLDGEEKLVFQESRHWQIAADSVVVNGGIVSSEAQFGGLQRKVAYVNSNWYAFYNDGTDVFYKKSADGITWGSAVNFDSAEDNDADNYNPSIDVSGNFIDVFWLDDSADQVQGMRLDTSTDLTSQTSVCGLTSPGAFDVTTYLVSVAAFDATNALVAYSDTTGGGSNVDVFEVASLGSATCTSTDVSPGNVTFGTQGSGITAGDRPALVNLNSTSAMMIYTDGSNLLSAYYDASTDEWRRNNALIAAISDSTYSVAANAANVWVLTQNSTTATRLYSCCTTDIAETQIDADAGANDQDGISDIDMFCPTEDNCKIVYTDNIDTTTPDLNFVDCNDASCSSPTISVINDVNADLGDAGDSAGASIFCVTDGVSVGGNCKVVYGDLLGGNSSDLYFVDCTNDEDCSTHTSTQVDSDMASGNDTSMVHTSIYCPSDTDCKFIYNDELLTDLFFVDCPDATCSGTAGTCTSGSRTCTALDTTYGTGGTQVAPWNDIYCVATDNCKVVYHDNNATGGCLDANSLCFVDCSDATCANTQTPLDSDIGTTLGGSPVSIDCVGGDTECTVVYGDGTDGDLTFIDCEGSATCAAGSTITDIDITGGADTGLTKKVSLSCTANNDCKIFYVGDLTSGSEDAYFVDCDNEICTSGSAYDLPGPRFGGAVECLTTVNCKLAYYDGTAAVAPTVQFANCDTEDCLPTWSTLTAPWTSETNVISVSLTYDSDNSDLIANIIKDASEKAYYSVSDATTIAWGATTGYDFTGGDLDNISTPASSSGNINMGSLLRQGANVEFDLLAGGPTLNQSMRHGKWYSGSKQAFTF